MTEWQVTLVLHDEFKSIPGTFTGDQLPNAGDKIDVEVQDGERMAAIVHWVIPDSKAPISASAVPSETT
jgi:hypothetical protein